MRLLIVEDDKKLAAFITKGFRESGFAVDHCADGEEGVIMATGNEYDAAIIDIMLPSLDGLSLIKEMRKKRIVTPVLILSAKGSVDDRVKGLQIGGDDYLAKPFAFAELHARIQALIRRGSQTAEPSSLVVGDVTLDLLARRVTRAGHKIDLHSREFALLEVLDAQCRTCGHQDDDSQSYLGLQLRSPNQRCRRACLSASEQDRQRIYPEADPNSPRNGLCFGGDLRS